MLRVTPGPVKGKLAALMDKSILDCPLPLARDPLIGLREKVVRTPLESLLSSGDILDILHF